MPIVPPEPTAEEKQKEVALRELELILQRQKVFSGKTYRLVREKKINDAGNPEITYLLPISGKMVKAAPDGTLTAAALRVTVTIEGHQIVIG